MKKPILIALAVAVLLTVGLSLAVRLLLSPDSVRSAVETQAGAAFGMPVKVGAARVQLWPRAGLSLADVRVGEPAQVRLRHALISTGLWALLSRRVEDAEVIVQDSRVDLRELLGTLEALGGTEAAPDADGGASWGFTIASVRRIGLRDVDVVVGERHATVNVESSLAGDRLDISHLAVRSEHSAIEATGQVESLARRVVRLSIVGDPLDVDGLLELATALSETAATKAADQPRGDPVAIDLRADVRAERGRIAGMTFSELETRVALTPDRVTLAPLSLGLFEGRLDGEIAVGLASAPPQLNVAGTFKDIDLQQLSAFAGQPSAITGTLNGRTRLTGRGLDPTSALQKARGTGEVSLVKGRIPGLNVVRPVVLFFGHPEGTAPEGDGEAFERVSATLAIEAGRIRTNDLIFESRDVDANGAGSLTLATSALDMKADLLLSKELSGQAGRDLVRYAREGDRVVLPATVSGTVTSPRVMIDEAQALNRALRNELERRTKSLLERLIPKDR